MGVIGTVFFVNGASFANWLPRIDEVRDAIGAGNGGLGAALLGGGLGGMLGSLAAARLLRPGRILKVLRWSAAGLDLAFPLLAVVPLDEVWVTANFKETQLEHIKAGQRATMSVDGWGGKTIQGHVHSLAAATGARFSLLPPENATGNFVKVVQRVPVKIVLEAGQDPDGRLRPGMSVTASVFTK